MSLDTPQDVIVRRVTTHMNVDGALPEARELLACTITPPPSDTLRAALLTEAAAAVWGVLTRGDGDVEDKLRLVGACVQDWLEDIETQRARRPAALAMPPNPKEATNGH